jgi:predicted branched-subunit amino acid permease
MALRGTDAFKSHRFRLRQPVEIPGYMNDTNVSASPRGRWKSGFKEGFQISTTVMPGMAAWGLVTGMAMVQSGLTLWQALGMTFIVYGGSAQLASLPLIAADVPIWVIFITTVVVNLRFVIFSATLGPQFAHFPWLKRLWYGYFNIDITIAFFSQRFPPHATARLEEKAGFYAAIGYSQWWAWQIGSVAGILLATQIPPDWGVGFAGTLALLAIMIPLIVNSAALAGVAVAGIVAILAVGLPYKLGLLLAVFVGMGAAMAVDVIVGSKQAGAGS